MRIRIIKRLDKWYYGAHILEVGEYPYYYHETPLVSIGVKNLDQRFDFGFPNRNKRLPGHSWVDSILILNH